MPITLLGFNHALRGHSISTEQMEVTLLWRSGH